MKQNQAKTRYYFFAFLKVAPTQFNKVLVSNHVNMRGIRQKFVDGFHDKVPISINKVLPGKEVFYFNAYSTIGPLNECIEFDLNDADAVQLADIDSEGLVLSIVGQVRFTGSVMHKDYYRDGKQRSDLMREALISDGTRTVKLTIWGDLIDLIKEDQLIQLCNASSRHYNEELVITTNFSTSVCYLTESLEIEFDESLSSITSEEGNKNDEVICCPNIESMKVDSFLSCKVCHKKVSIFPGTGLCRCPNCKREFTVKLIESLPACNQKAVVLDLYTAGNRNLSVTVFGEVLVRFFGENVVANDIELKTTLLNADKIDFTILKDKKIVKDISYH